MRLVKEHINEKFKEDSDPISDMNIGVRSLLKKVKNLILEILESDSEDEVDEWEETDNLDTDGTYKIEAHMDTFGMSDICDYIFEFDANTGMGELTVYEADGINRRKWDFTVKKPLKKFADMTRHQYLHDIYFDSEEELEEWEAEDLGYYNEDDDDD
jgi:hypothetical protein